MFNTKAARHGLSVVGWCETQSKVRVERVSAGIVTLLTDIAERKPVLCTLEEASMNCCYSCELLPLLTCPISWAPSTTTLLLPLHHHGRWWRLAGRVGAVLGPVAHLPAVVALCGKVLGVGAVAGHVIRGTTVEAGVGVVARGIARKRQTTWPTTTATWPTTTTTWPTITPHHHATSWPTTTTTTWPTAIRSPHHATIVHHHPTTTTTSTPVIHAVHAVHGSTSHGHAAHTHAYACGALLLHRATTSTASTSSTSPIPIPVKVIIPSGASIVVGVLVVASSHKPWLLLLLHHHVATPIATTIKGFICQGTKTIWGCALLELLLLLHHAAVATAKVINIIQVVKRTILLLLLLHVPAAVWCVAAGIKDTHAHT